MKASKLAEDACLLYEIMKSNKDGNVDKKFVQESKMISFEKNAKEIEFTYKTSINEFNDFLEFYHNQTVFFLNKYGGFYIMIVFIIVFTDGFDSKT